MKTGKAWKGGKARYRQEAASDYLMQNLYHQVETAKERYPSGSGVVHRTPEEYWAEKIVEVEERILQA